MGNFRSKDTAAFNEYDVVLTTYGTMLRDIEILRGYKFHQHHSRRIASHKKSAGEERKGGTVVEWRTSHRDDRHTRGE